MTVTVDKCYINTQVRTFSIEPNYLQMSKANELKLKQHRRRKFNGYLVYRSSTEIWRSFPCHKLQESGGDFFQVVGVPKVPVHPGSSFHVEGRWRTVGVKKRLSSRSVISRVHGFLKPFRITCWLIWMGSMWCPRHIRPPKNLWKQNNVKKLISKFL